MSADDLKARLRAVESSATRDGVTTNWHRNPDGPEAADRIATLEAEVERLREVVERGAAWFVEYADQHEAKSRIAHGGEAVARREKAKRNRERANYLLAALKNTDFANRETPDAE